MAEHKLTGEEACKEICRWLKATRGEERTPEEIWNASPTGELWHVFSLYKEALPWLKEHPEPIVDHFVVRIDNFPAGYSEAICWCGAVHVESIQTLSWRFFTWRDGGARPGYEKEARRG